MRYRLSPAPLGPVTTQSNIAVASTFVYHYDVYLALAWTLQSILPATSTLRVFRPGGAEPFSRGFQEIAERLELYRGTYYDAEQLVDEVSLGEIDTIIFGTCEFDLAYFSEALLRLWDMRAQDNKFDVVCQIHNIKHTSMMPYMTDWIARGSFRIIASTEHVAEAFQRLFIEKADSKDIRLRNAGYAYVPIDIVVPILPLFVDVPKPDRKKLSQVMLQGNFDLDRRDYTGLFNDLVASLNDDPSAWGYRRGPVDFSNPSEPHATYLPDHDLDGEPFVLNLIGGGDFNSLRMPPELASGGIVRTAQDLVFSDFYEAVHNSDIVLPTFVDDRYYKWQGSSVAFLATECDAAILVTSRFREAYKYLDDDRVVITRPMMLGEVEALKVLRTGEWKNGTTLDPRVKALVQAEVDDLLRLGWKRSKSGFNAYKQQVWLNNERSMRRVVERRT
ncbi:hypothetical protein CYLTODRAFT_342440 [Cylindrobasidium torrendii FP15055 ss-10]|uniref:Glycosyltransferase family 1 protein n=1 Tax=Cylindrobasidium torrendii FP15055 ss-10 TaxID=1314674 RepID=A0A0D7BS90_9AGAR|nr:hypothetical protein CYLTODRAFT_342440 [Cylindrobasidium torrendii FP15055 ss-10]